MNLYLAAVVVLVAALGPCLWVAVRADTLSGLVALQAAGTVTALTLLVLAEGAHRSPYFDVAVVAAVLNFGSIAVFARFLERWL